MNGATQTFRRPSVATNPSHHRESSQSTAASVSTPITSTTTTGGAYAPSHMTSSQHPSTGVRNGLVGDSRYSKEQLLELYRSQRDSGVLGKNVSDCFVADWDPHLDSGLNGGGSGSGSGAWGKREDQKDAPTGPEICWDHTGQVEPLALVDMTDDEKDLFATSVNSPLKPPPSNVPKDNQPAGTTAGRKSSVSYSQNFNTSSPGSARPGGPRRRETGESTAGANPMSPTPGSAGGGGGSGGGSSRFFREEPNTSTPPPSLLRRKTDFREPGANKVEERDIKDGPDTVSPFGSLKRSSTNPLNTGSNSPWASASQSATFSPMGAFGAFSLGGGGGGGGSGAQSSTTTPTTEKKPGFSSLRGESRLKGLFSKDSSEDIDPSSSIKEKSSFGNLKGMPLEGDGSRAPQSPWGDTVKTRAGRSETNPFAEEPRSGSAALGGSQDVEPSAASQAAADQLGFSAFGMTSSIPGFRELMQSHENSRNPTPSLLHGHEPSSPTNTNPYQSPHGDRRADVEDLEGDGSDNSGGVQQQQQQQQQHAGLGGGIRDPTSANPFDSMRRVGSGVDLPTSIDRSQSSSVAGNRSFSGLGGLGGLPALGTGSGWPGSGAAAVGTPTRERFGGFPGAFGDPIFGGGGGGGDLQSPSLSTLGGSGLFSPHAGGITGANSIGRSSKLGSLFPAAMQDQMHGEQGEDSFQQQMDKAGQGIGSGGVHLPTSTSASQTPVSAVGSVPAGMTSGDVPQPSQTPGQSTSNPGSVPPAQQRTMVMPDRMRWIYRDPQGNVQGPWTGLEMHDWFKAGFFSPDLQIKKLEDPEFEPLAQLVRRIGNSREPFLVPQIGIPHGPDPNAAAWTAPTGAAQPPFPGSFPSFGTTLTAEQQNALERRKQEEQYLMARQKEHLAQQQALMKQMQLQGLPPTMHPQQLQHQSSAHSLHSQPSIGSITSPVGFQPSPIQAPQQQQQPQSQPQSQGQNVPGLLGSLPNLGGAGGPQVLGGDLVNSQDQLPALLDRLNMSRPDPFAFGSPSSLNARQPENLFHQQQVANMLQDRAQLQQEQDQFDSMQGGDSLFDQQAREERLRQFHALRAQEGEFGMRTAEGLPTHPAIQQNDLEQSEFSQDEGIAAGGGQPPAGDESLTLSQQVHKAATAQRQQQEQEQKEQEDQEFQEEQDHQQGGQGPRESVWNKVDSAMPRPFPPPPSASPLPAPAAQRSRQNVAESLAANSRSQTQTPVEAPATTSIAPWAKDANELPKGPSLKEIQEAEARTAAEKEEVAAAARRAQLLAEQERISQAQQVQSPGLPSTANWASTGSPATPTSTTSVWNNKGQTTSTGTKKTLAQIQKEEEARKQRMANAAAAAAAASSSSATASPTVATSPPAPASVGKRYADLAGKAPTPSSPAAAPPVSGAWTTVGAGGKPKAPLTAPAAPRAISGGAPVIAAPKPKPAAAAAVATSPRPLSVNTATPPANPNHAVEEFTKWAKLTLGKGLNSNINGELSFFSFFLFFFCERIYAN